MEKRGQNGLKRVFKLKDLGEPENFLGMKIQRDREKREMTITQPEYIKKMLERFNMSHSNPQETPMVTRQVKKRNQECKKKQPESLKSKTVTTAPYREAIGSLMYAAGTVRPDIAYSVYYLARKQQAPTEEDWQDVKRVFRYFKGT